MSTLKPTELDRDVTVNEAPAELWLHRLVWLSLVCACLPVLAAVFHALDDQWLAIGDNGYFVVRARDVLTRHHPLIGAWSSGSSSLEESINNLGPLQLDLLAPFAKLAPAAGTAIGVGAVQLASVVGTWVALRRITNEVVVIVAMAAIASVEWSMGSAMLVETRQHPYLVLPFVCLMVLAWAAATGALWAVPWATFVASLVLQTHLSYLFLVAALVAWALGALGLGLWRRRRDDPAAWELTRPQLMRTSVTTAVVALLCWIQPLIDQFAGRGNLGKLFSAGSDGEAPGLDVGTEIVAGVLTRPRWWLRPAFRDFDVNRDRPGAAFAAVSLVVLTLLLLAAAAAAWRRRDRHAFAGIVTVGVALVAGIASASVLLSSFFGLNPANYRWLWSLGAMLVVALAAAAYAAARLPERPQLRLSVAGGFAVLALVLAILSVPYSYQSFAVEGAPRIDTTRALLDQLDELQVDGTVLYDRSEAAFTEPYTYPLLVKLQELGIEFEFSDPRDVRRFGDEREADGDATERLSIVVPDVSGEGPPGSRRIAFLEGLGPEEQREYDALLAEIVDGLETGRIGVDLAAARQSTGNDLVHVGRLLDGHDVSSAEVAGDLVQLTRKQLLEAQDDDQERLDRWHVLHDERLIRTVGIYLTPIADGD